MGTGSRVVKRHFPRHRSLAGRNLNVTLSLLVRERREFIKRQRVALQRVDKLPAVAIRRLFADAQRRARPVHQPAIVLLVRPALAAKGLE